MNTPIRAWTEAQKARRARKLARRAQKGIQNTRRTEPNPTGDVEKARVARIRARRTERLRKRLAGDYGPETIARWMRYLGFVAGGAPLRKHRARKATRASRREARR